MATDIDTVALRSDSFDAFFAARMSALVDAIESAMGVHVVRDVTQAVSADSSATDLPDNFEPEGDDTTDDEVLSEAETNKEWSPDVTD